MAELTYHDVARVLKADFKTGKLYWLPRTPDMFNEGKQSTEHRCRCWNGRYAGKEAFAAIGNHGYRQGKIFDRDYRAHRIIWLLHTGDWPTDEIDHINGKRTDNRVSNLRSVSRAENNKNMRVGKRNTSGIPGVGLNKKSGKWRAYIMLDGINRNLGSFDDIGDAAAARNAAQVEYGFHANHGRSIEQ